MIELFTAIFSFIGGVLSTIASWLSYRTSHRQFSDSSELREYGRQRFSNTDLFATAAAGGLTSVEIVDVLNRHHDNAAHLVTTTPSGINEHLATGIDAANADALAQLHEIVASGGSDSAQGLGDLLNSVGDAMS